MKSPPRPSSVRPAMLRRGARLPSGLFDELIVDNFAGAGGASLGIEAALGRSVDIAINHDRGAVEVHRVNHPNTRHLCEDVWDVDPIKATAGKPVGLAWFSPDCKHFSRAKGGKPVEKRIRGLAWIVIRWAKAVRPRVIILENVQEFTTWGPLTADNKPCPDRKGNTFNRWRKTLENLGYVVETRVLNAADYGVPTHRRRFFLVARRDGLPINWPEPTHGPGRAKPYRTAAECIDWSLPCPSIFLTREDGRKLSVNRPLADKTMLRIAMGMKRYVLDNLDPFIVTFNHGGAEFQGQGVDEPLKTVTASRDAHGVTLPFVVRTDHHQSHATNAFDARAPIGTITSTAGHAVISPFLAEVQNGSNEAGHRAIDRPAHTVTAHPKGGGVALVAPFLAQNYGEAPHQETRGQSVAFPLNTITPANNSGVVVAPFIAKHFGGPRPPVGHVMDRPLGTVTAVDHHSVVAAHLTKYHGQKGNESCAKSPTDPLPTADASNRFGVVVAHMTKFRGGSVGSFLGEPMPTITSGAGSVRPAGAAHALGVVAANLVHMNHGDKQWSDAREPMRTITTGGQHAAVVASLLAPPAVAFRPDEVRAFLSRYYSSGGQVGAVDAPAPTITSVDRIGLVVARGQEYQVVDIGLRMLSPRELLNAQFGRFAKNYVLIGTKSRQVAGIGNSVCPELSEALVRANFAGTGGAS